MSSISRIGPFALENPIPGSSGTLFRAIHVEQKLAAAVRILSVPFGVGDATKTGFVHEAGQLKGLKHPNIVRCYGGAIAKDQAYLAYEFVDGESLEDLLSKRGRLAWEQVVDIGLQVARGLEFAHERKIVHQAIMPDKILLKEDGTVKIADFRAERHGGLNPPVKITIERVAYLAPEQLTPNGVVTERTDVYSLGCIFHRMLTGVHPFVAADPKALAQMHREVVPQRVAKTVMDCPVWLDRLVEQMLKKDPNQRPYTAAAVRLALEETQRNIAEGRGVAEHVTRGASALRMGDDRDEARTVLGRDKKKKKKKQSKKQADAPFYENIWFLLGALMTLIIVVGVMMIPPGEEEMYQTAKKLIDSGDDAKIRRAVERHLEPMLRRFPDGKHADEARDHIDTFKMGIVEKRMKLNINLNREPKRKTELLLMVPWRYKLFGDRAMTMKLCADYLETVEDTKENRTYRKLAEREIAEISDDDDVLSSQEFLDAMLDEADDLVAAENFRGARRIWRQIERLYATGDFSEAVATARQNLEQYPADGAD